ncbi:MAG: RluA family pseudouridine synthase, partial [Lachnospiraceae bacterium]|nr:RluA family pseudouridine synthase [Lachnospiraceae bacterium]
MRQFTVSPGEEGQNVFKFASRILAKAPGSMVHKFIRNKNVELNGKKAAEKTVLRSGDVVSFFLSDETFNKFAAQSKPEGGKKQLKAALSVFEGNVLFQNEHVLFINKWDNIISQSDGGGEVSLNDLLLEYMGDKFKSYTVKPSIANRLDRNTTGVVACGLSATGLKELNALIKDRDIKKTYLAFSVGKSSLSGEYTAFLGKDNASNTVTVSDRPENDSFREIKTGFKVHCTLKTENEIITVYEVRLITGRSHQIRAHLKYL